MNQSQLKHFLIVSNNAGYASGMEKKWVKEPDGSTTIPFEKGLWKSHDNFFGGEPYGGRTIVFYKDKPYWIMVYYGWIVKGTESNPIYKVLRNALKNMPKDYPYRGPREYKDGEYIYSNNWEGEVDKYAGEEKITIGNKLVYKANYLGGLVDQRGGV